MHATIIECDMHTIASSHERGRAGRNLATFLSEIPGFVAFVALDADAGRVAALCIFEDPAGTEAAGRTIEAWQREHRDIVGADSRRFATGEVIVQKGL